MSRAHCNIMNARAFKEVCNMNKYETEIIEMYRKNSQFYKNCQSVCSSKGLPQSGPLSFFNIGDSFGKKDDKYKVVFVGKNHYYVKEDADELDCYPRSIFRDCRADGADMFRERRKGYWDGLRKITDLLYPDEKDNPEKILDYIVITNLTKCSTSSGSEDTTPDDLTDNCAKILEEEIKILKPKHLVFFTGRYYIDYVKKMGFNYNCSPENRSEQENTKKIGRQKVFWWEREFSDNTGKMFLLNTRHPAIAPKGFATAVSNWIKQEK